MALVEANQVLAACVSREIKPRHRFTARFTTNPLSLFSGIHDMPRNGPEAVTD